MPEQHGGGQGTLLVRAQVAMAAHGPDAAAAGLVEHQGAGHRHVEGVHEAGRLRDDDGLIRVLQRLVGDTCGVNIGPPYQNSSPLYMTCVTTINFGRGKKAEGEELIAGEQLGSNPGSLAARRSASIEFLFSYGESEGLFSLCPRYLGRPIESPVGESHPTRPCASTRP